MLRENTRVLTDLENLVNSWNFVIWKTGRLLEFYVRPGIFGADLR